MYYWCTHFNKFTHIIMTQHNAFWISRCSRLKKQNKTNINQAVNNVKNARLELVCTISRMKWMETQNALNVYVD